MGSGVRLTRARTLPLSPSSGGGPSSSLHEVKGRRASDSTDWAPCSHPSPAFSPNALCRQSQRPASLPPVASDDVYWLHTLLESQATWNDCAPHTWYPGSDIQTYSSHSAPCTSVSTPSADSSTAVEEASRRASCPLTTQATNGLQFYTYPDLNGQAGSADSATVNTIAEQPFELSTCPAYPIG